MVNYSFSLRILTTILVPTIIVLDLSTKYEIARFGYEFSCNSGIAFGIGSVGYFAPVVVLGSILWLLMKEQSLFSKVGLLLILGGGVSNLVDRIFYGCVRDFIAIGILPAFNLADVAISIGAIGLFLSILKTGR